MYTYWCHSRDRADIQTHFSSKNQTISYCIKQKCLVVWTIAFRRHTGLLTSVPSHLRIQLHTKCMRYSSQTGRNSTPETKRSKFTYSAHAWRLMHVSLVMLVLHELRFMKPTARPSTFSRLCKRYPMVEGIYTKMSQAIAPSGQNQNFEKSVRHKGCPNIQNERHNIPTSHACLRQQTSKQMLLPLLSPSAPHMLSWLGHLTFGSFHSQIPTFRWVPLRTAPNSAPIPQLSLHHGAPCPQSPCCSRKHPEQLWASGWVDSG